MNLAVDLDRLPDHLSITQMLKATPFTSGADRFVYLEASNESRDQQNEVVLAKALSDSADYFLKFGNLDIDHYTQIGAKQGIPNFETYEIGRPVEVRVDGSRTFVKGQIYSGNGSSAERANEFWSSLTEISPPKRWYPSVGGSILNKSVAIGEDGVRRATIKAVRWTNIGFSKTPVNDALPTVGVVPIGVLTKCWTAAGFDLGKALEAGCEPDVAKKVDAGAFAKQSLDKRKKKYLDMRDQFADVMSKGGVMLNLAAMAQEARSLFSIDMTKAEMFVDRFLGDLHHDLATKEKS